MLEDDWKAMDVPDWDIVMEEVSDIFFPAEECIRSGVEDYATSEDGYLDEDKDREAKEWVTKVLIQMKEMYLDGHH